MEVPRGGAAAGALAIVESPHILKFNIDGVNFYRVEIHEGATIEIQQTSQHQLGRVTGTGTIQVTGSGNLPAGDYTNFFGYSGRKLNFISFSSQNFEVLSNVLPINEATLLGNGDITIADNTVNICEKLAIENFIELNAANSALLDVGEDIVPGPLTQFNLRQGNTIVHGNLMINGTQTSGGFITAGNNGQITVEGDLELGGQGMSLGTVFRETHLEGNAEKITEPPA